jgi:hypothetical protein
MPILSDGSDADEFRFEVWCRHVEEYGPDHSVSTDFRDREDAECHAEVLNRSSHGQWHYVKERDANAF